MKLLEQSKVKEIADFFLNEVDRETTANYYLYDGGKVSKLKYIKDKLTNKFLKNHGILNEFTDIEDDEMKRGKFFSGITDEISVVLKEKSKENTLSKFGVVELPDISVDPFQYVPFIDAARGTKVMVDKTLGKASKLDFDVWFRLVPIEDKKPALESIRAGILTFDPYQTKPFETALFERQEVIKLNLYEPPKWMQDERGIVKHLSEEDKEDLECPAIIMEFMQHLFPDEECRDFVFNWMHYSLTRRCETYLTLNGKKGVGKGIFCNQIMQSLVGEDNYLIAPESILDSIFNSALENTRLLVLDEVRVDNDKQLNRLKKYANNKQNIEKKGIDANNVTETFSSNIISNNDIMDMRLTWDERRFSIPELSDKPLLEVWSQEDIDSFIKSFDSDEEMVREFGYWIFYKARSSRFHEFSAWKGDRFNTIVYHSLSEWKKVIVDLILGDKYGDGVAISACKKEYKNRVDNGKFPVKPRRIKEFLDDYRHNGKDQLGELVFNADEQEHEIVNLIVEKEKKEELNDDHGEHFDLL